jgi:hypothetical protein
MFVAGHAIRRPPSVTGTVQAWVFVLQDTGVSNDHAETVEAIALGAEYNLTENRVKCLLPTCGARRRQNSVAASGAIQSDVVVRRQGRGYLECGSLLPL